MPARILRRKYPVMRCDWCRHMIFDTDKKVKSSLGLTHEVCPGVNVVHGSPEWRLGGRDAGFEMDRRNKLD